jgi:hypothetical protein
MIEEQDPALVRLIEKRIFATCQGTELGSPCEACGSRNTRAIGNIKVCKDCGAKQDMNSMHNRINRDSWGSR